MKALIVSISETSKGFVRVTVPDDATEEEIYSAASDAYCRGEANFDDSEFDVLGHEEE